MHPDIPTGLLATIASLREEVPRIQSLINVLQGLHQTAQLLAAAQDDTSMLPDPSSPPTFHAELIAPMTALSWDTNPFDSPEADIVLKTCDGVEFRVFKCILSQASPFFCTMFSLPQTQHDQGKSAQVVDMVEHSKIIEALLRLLYPLPDPPIHFLDDVNDLIAAAVKYDLTGPLQTLRQLLISPKFTSLDPFRIFTIATRHQLTDEITIAARHTFNVSLLDMPLTEDHNFITGLEFFKLLKLHQRRTKEAQDIIRNARALFKCSGCSHRDLKRSPTWWKDWESRAFEELGKRPSSKLIFSPTFVSKSAKSARNHPVIPCADCAFSILESQSGLEALKIQIDSLPVTL